MQLVSAAGCWAGTTAWLALSPSAVLAAISSDHLPDPADSPQVSLQRHLLCLRGQRKDLLAGLRGVCVCVREGVSTCLLAAFCRAAAFLFINATSQTYRRGYSNKRAFGIHRLLAAFPVSGKWQWVSRR